VYGRHRVLLNSSQVESFGNVVVESLAARTPVLAGDCDFGPREILRGAHFSRVVARSAPELAEALREVVARPPDEDEAAECLAIARRYAPGAVLPEIEELLAAVAG
jgi:glycosyltransferase involved in cell wall biosynthesis